MSAEDALVREWLIRAAVYRLLGGALAYPGPDRLEATIDMARALAAADQPATGGELRSFLAAAEASDPAALAAEHVFLFDRAARCPPYEAAWGPAQLAGKSALLADVAGFYAAFGLEPSEVQPDAEDHMGAECEFMSALALKEAYALVEGVRDGAEITRAGQTRFLADHLGRWATVFADALKAATPVPFYTALADLLAAWVAADARRLGVEPARLAAPDAPDAVQDEEAFTCPMVAAVEEEPVEEEPR